MAGSAAISENRCRLEETFTSALLNDRDDDPCLAETPFIRIPESLGSVVPDTGRKVRATWYANGNQWHAAKNGEVFNTYDYVIAVTDDLLREYPRNSLVKVSYIDPKTGETRSVIARVIDKKPGGRKVKRSPDLSKEVAYALAGNNMDLIRAGAFQVTIERFKVDPVMDPINGPNVFLKMGEWEYSEDPHQYEAAVKKLWELATFLKENINDYQGLPRPYLALVHQRVDGSVSEEKIMVQLRLGDLRSETELEYFYQQLRPFSNKHDLPLEVSSDGRIYNFVRYDFLKKYLPRINVAHNFCAIFAPYTPEMKQKLGLITDNVKLHVPSNIGGGQVGLIATIGAALAFDLNFEQFFLDNFPEIDPTSITCK